MKYCTYCGKQVADEAVICLNCGCSVCRVPHMSVAAPVCEDPTPATATWAKICGIVSFFVGWFVLGITAMVLASVSKDDTGGIMCPSARVGFVCGLVATILYVLFFVAVICVYTAMMI